MSSVSASSTMMSGIILSALINTTVLIIVVGISEMFKHFYLLPVEMSSDGEFFSTGLGILDRRSCCCDCDLYFWTPIFSCNKYSFTFESNYIRIKRSPYCWLYRTLAWVMQSSDLVIQVMVMVIIWDRITYSVLLVMSL